MGKHRNMGRRGGIKLDTDNRGISLVEVIVSLLILMIIIVPLLSGFVTASMTNKKSKEMIYAHTAGENIMEAVKALGVEETAREFSDCGSRDKFSVVSEGLHGSYYEVAVDGRTSIVTSDGKKSYVPLASNGTYEYRIDGVEGGTHKYDVDITISALDIYSGEGMPNSYQYADLTAFSSDAVAVINPVIQGSTYDNKALSYFHNMNKRVMSDRYQAVCSAIDARNAAKYNDYETRRENGEDVQPPDLESYPPAAGYKALGLSEVRNDISKRVVIRLEQEADGTGQYVLNSEIVYSCVNRGDADGRPLYSTDVASYPVGSTDKKIEMAPYNGFCRDQRYDSLDTVMLIYKPINDLNNLNKETIELVKDVDTPLDLYIAMQGDGDTDFTGITNLPRLVISGTGRTDKDADKSYLNIYSQAEFDIAGTTLNESQKHFGTLLGDLKASNKLYNISVKVYGSGSSYTKLVSQLDSTMLDG